MLGIIHQASRQGDGFETTKPSAWRCRVDLLRLAADDVVAGRVVVHERREGRRDPGALLVDGIVKGIGKPLYGLSHLVFVSFGADAVID